MSMTFTDRSLLLFPQFCTGSELRFRVQWGKIIKSHAFQFRKIVHRRTGKALLDSDSRAGKDTGTRLLWLLRKVNSVFRDSNTRVRAVCS